MTRLLLVSLLALVACTKSDPAPPAPTAIAATAATAPSVVASASAPPSAIVAAPSSVPSSSASSEITYIPYKNGRFCFQLDTPRGMVAEPPPMNGDGQTWKSTDGSVELTAWGQNLVTPEQGLDSQFADESKATATRKVTMKLKDKSGFVVSGYDGAEIFYEKYVFAADHYAAFRVKYPVSGKAWWNRAVEHMAPSFRLC